MVFVMFNFTLNALQALSSWIQEQFINDKEKKITFNRKWILREMNIYCFQYRQDSYINFNTFFLNLTSIKWQPDDNLQFDWAKHYTGILTVEQKNIQSLSLLQTDP